MGVSASPSLYGLPLRGPEGELVTVQIDVEPKELENLLEALCEVTFPVNPQICHAGTDPACPAETTVEFPAYAGRLEEVRGVLDRRGFAAGKLRVSRMFEAFPSTTVAMDRTH